MTLIWWGFQLKKGNPHLVFMGTYGLSIVSILDKNDSIIHRTMVILERVKANYINGKWEYISVMIKFP